jgi:hypothetical protein
MLLNLSNHPFDKWSDSQKNAALALFDRVEDLPFPHIDPHWTPSEVETLVDSYVEKIVTLKPSAVHLMGELTFCFLLAQKLKNAGIPCLASTTERIVQEQGDQKISTFRFVQFRPYF